MDALRLSLLRANQWLGTLPARKATLVLAVMVLLVVAAYFGLLPRKHVWDNPHAILNW